jgi:NAD(P)-dependent dehydrogenase (short-subunit alcohol dehydrogenase family)
MADRAALARLGAGSGYEWRMRRLSKPPVPELAGRVSVITGAASGIGRATARLVVQRGGRVVLTDVNAAALDLVVDELGDAVVFSRALDVTDAEAVQTLAADVPEPVDIIMNVAGIATWGRVDRLTHEQWRRTVDVDLMGPIHVIEAFVPPLIAARRPGQIVNVSSAAGLIPLPWHAPYSAAKYGLRGVSEVLRHDLRRHRIGVTLVCPGGVDTGMVETVDIAGIDRAALAAFTGRFRKHAKSPEHVARCIAHGVVNNKALVHTSLDIRLLYGLGRVAPPLQDALLRAGHAVTVRQLEKAVSR